MPQVSCSVGGCDKSALTRSMCNRHYQRWLRGSPMEGSRPKPPRLACSVDGCDRLQVCRGHCAAHHSRLLRGSDLTQPIEQSTRPNWSKGRVCSIEECRERHQARGYCAFHYGRLRNYGDPLRERSSQAERFATKVDRNGPIPVRRPDLGSCWIWTGNKIRGGYGVFPSMGVRYMAHRWAWEAEHGPIAVGLEIDHLCVNPSCVRVKHLEPVTALENWWRSDAPTKINALKTHCAQGHPFSDENTYYPPKRGRVCRTCRAECSRRYREKRAATLRRLTS